MNHRFVGALVMCGVAALGGCASAITDEPETEMTREPAPRAVPGALTAAHEAYLDGDFVALGERVRDVLLDTASSDGVKENAYELLDKAYEAQGGALPSSFKLPAGYGKVQYVVFHNMTQGGQSYQVHLRVLARDATHLVGFTVRRLPGETLLDKASGKGHFAVLHNPASQKAGLDELVLDSGPVPAPPADGVLSLRIELDDGTVSEGFFIAHALASTATPEVRSPAAWASLSDPSPRVVWAPFRSPECAAFEQRSVGVQVRRVDEDVLAWEFWSKKPDDLTEARLGSPAGVGRTSLTPGDYRVMVVGGESRSFGPVEMTRGSRTVQPFRVAP